MNYSPWGGKESDATEQLSAMCVHTHIHIVTVTVRGGILTCSGCRNKNAIDWVSLTTEINFLMVLGTERKGAHVL